MNPTLQMVLLLMSSVGISLKRSILSLVCACMTGTMKETLCIVKTQGIWSFADSMNVQTDLNVNTLTAFPITESVTK